MKVGVDGVLVGCWSDAGGCLRILDVGTGCGLIALIMAQRYPESSVTGIDIDAESVAEAQLNVSESPWSKRIVIQQMSFSDMAEDDGKFDLIVSNPPYFDSGIKDMTSRRAQARHQGELSPGAILEKGKSILNQGGMVAIIVPMEISEELECAAIRMGYCLVKKCLVRGHKEAPIKRVMFQWRRDCDCMIMHDNEIKTDCILTLEEYPGIPTEDYRNLTKDFYLKF